MLAVITRWSHYTRHLHITDEKFNTALFLVIVMPAVDGNLMPISGRMSAVGRAAVDIVKSGNAEETNDIRLTPVMMRRPF